MLVGGLMSAACVCKGSNGYKNKLGCTSITRIQSIQGKNPPAKGPEHKYEMIFSISKKFSCWTKVLPNQLKTKKFSLKMHWNLQIHVELCRF